MISRLVAAALVAAAACSSGAFAGGPSPEATARRPPDRKVALVNGGFEDVGGSGVPRGWRVEGAPPDASARADSAGARSGKQGLRLSAVRAASATVSSDPVSLVVGRAYRLSAWIRTDRAFSDRAGRYPTPVPACLTMASFPFTNHSPAVGASSPWTRVEVVFVATTASDRVRLHLGLNGAATGTGWFDDVELAEVADISALVPPETVRWAGEGYRYDDRGWIFLHIEGEPYARGYQHGFLLADEIAAYIRKLSIAESGKDPAAGWTSLRLLADSLMLRGYDPELLEEMRGIADGAAKGGAKVDGRAIDLIDLVTVNSAVDLGQLRSGLRVTPHALSGRSFLKAEEELAIPEENHKCSAFVATGPATKDGRIVFGQIFMWSGYTGVHFNVLLDIVPTKGERLVLQTFPGGIHSGTDFYVNSAGIVIGETTVAQTPFDARGTPQSNRIRKAAQYAKSIDDVTRILREQNNGMYTNDWPIADVKTNEAAMLLLGTHKYKLWRTSEDMAPFGTPGFLWANNNARDPDVRSEYGAQPDDAPFDLIFAPWNRDVAFRRFYDAFRGKIDAIAGVNLWASSPINRPHACDGKITTSEMAERLVFLAHYGKVTLREKFPQSASRRMPDLPGASPHLSLGYSVASPIFVTEALKAQKDRIGVATTPPKPSPKVELGELAWRYSVESRRLWRGTLAPASDRDNWLVSAGAAYWQILKDLPADQGKAFDALSQRLAELRGRYLFTVAREPDLAAVDARRAYDRYGPYLVPRIKGTFLLHQLRLRLGNEAFLRLMGAFSEAHASRAASADEFVAAASAVAGADLGPFVAQWTSRKGLPQLRPAVRVDRAESGWTVEITVTQSGEPYHLFGSVAIDAGGKRRLHPIEIRQARENIEVRVPERPERVAFDPGGDIPVATTSFDSWASFAEEFDNAVIVYGTSRQIEANHTLALRWQQTLADGFAEILPPVVKDCEVTAAQLGSSHLIVLGSPEDNALAARVAKHLPAEFGKNLFRFRGELHARPEEGLFLVGPSPFNPKKALFLFAANSALQLHEMTKVYPTSLPGWALFRGDEVTAKGDHAVPLFVFDNLGG
jgi:hypothetical protein